MLRLGALGSRAGSLRRAMVLVLIVDVNISGVPVVLSRREETGGMGWSAKFQFFQCGAKTTHLRPEDPGTRASVTGSNGAAIRLLGLEWRWTWTSGSEIAQHLLLHFNPKTMPLRKDTIETTGHGHEKPLPSMINRSHHCLPVRSVDLLQSHFQNRIDILPSQDIIVAIPSPPRTHPCVRS